jgi:hypothetical protein
MPTAGRVLDVNEIIEKDQLACSIGETWNTWFDAKRMKIARWQEVRRYISATDTTTTSNSTLPWKNTVTMPKLTQIRDNLSANYMASMFPNPRWLAWEADREDDASVSKASAIKAYMGYVVEQKRFKDSILQLTNDFIDTGNAFVMADWLDERVDQPNRIQQGYVGPVVTRISPYDIVFNPAAPSFEQTPKIVRSLITLGDLKELLQRMTSDDGEKEWADNLWKYFKEMRSTARQYPGDISAQEEFFRIDGFDSYSTYLKSDYVEILTFYGDMYLKEDDELLKNHIIMVVDRHKIIRKEPNPSAFGYPPIIHVGWRQLSDNLWAMGPLENLVGLQYRIDHLENLKADLFDLVAFPPVHIKGHVPPFTWGPLEQIVTDADGDIKLLTVDSSPLAANLEITELQNKMEEMAGAPKEAMGFRTPGEKTKYEVQRLENAAARIFQNKISTFEEQLLEPLLNLMLELARRRMDPAVVRVINDEFKIATFLDITAEDITGAGRIRPMAARHFVERAERIQNITAWYQSGIGADQDVRLHMSSIELARFSEEMLDLEGYRLVSPYVRITERAHAERLTLQEQEDTAMGIQEPGMSDDDQFGELMGESGLNQPGEGISLPTGGLA